MSEIGIDPRRLFCAGGVLALGLALAGCRGTLVQGEKEAREKAHAAAESYRPGGRKPELPALSTNSTLRDFIAYALLNQPKVEAAYFDWLAAVERITVQRSLPDPQLTFQMDIQEVVTSLMPGLMMSFPGMGKLRAAGAVAAAESESKYFAFKAASLESAYEVKRAYYQVCFLEQKLQVNRESLGLLSDLEKLARAQNEVGKATLQDVLRAEVEQERLKTEITNLEDSRGLLMARFKAALGRPAGEPTPPVPARFEWTPIEVSSDQVLERALAENLRLKAMEAEVHGAEAAIRLAYKARMPDTSLGLMADAKMSPVLYRPWGTVSLPIWRDKLAAQVAEAQAARNAGEARLSAEQINLAVDVAERTFLFREASRNLELLDQQVLPRQRLALEAARSGYLAGQVGFVNLADAGLELLRSGLDRVEASTQRELALAELALIVQGMPPSGAPMVRGTMSGTSGRRMSPSVGGMGSGAGGMGTGAPAMLPGNSAPPKMESPAPMK